jgi:hypothetical protein
MKLLSSGTETVSFMLRENDWGFEITSVDNSRLRFGSWLALALDRAALKLEASALTVQGRPPV